MLLGAGRFDMSGVHLYCLCVWIGHWGLGFEPADQAGIFCYFHAFWCHCWSGFERVMDLMRTEVYLAGCNLTQSRARYLLDISDLLHLEKGGVD